MILGIMDSLISLSSIILYFHNNHNLFKRGENSFKSKNVKEVAFDGNLKIIRGKVNASMKQRTYAVEIRLSDDYEVETAQCECPRGLEICHHIAATLLASHYEISKTDSDCSWAPKPSEANNVHTVDEVFNIPKPPRMTNRDLSEMEMRELYEELQKVPPVGFKWILRNHFENDEPGDDDTNVNDAIIDSVDIARFIFSKDFDNASNKTKFLKERMRLRAETISEISKITNGQTNNVDWFVIRKNRITASNFGKVINSAIRNRFPPSLFSSLYDQQDLRGVKAIQWGITHENDGLDALRKILKTDISSCGIFLSESGVLGASPDGIIDEDYVVEIKCPFKYRNVLLSEVLTTDTSYILYWNSSGKMWLNKKHPYFHQIQGQIYLSNRKGCHLCIWTPKQAVHCLILKDDTWGSNFQLIKKFYFEKYVPYIKSQFQ